VSLSPFDSFQSRFVTYLLNFPRISLYSINSLAFTIETEWVILRGTDWIFKRNSG